jgi:hypothetical protein
MKSKVERHSEEAEKVMSKWIAGGTTLFDLASIGGSLISRRSCLRAFQSLCTRMLQPSCYSGSLTQTLPLRPP